MDSAYRKWMRDVRDAQRPSGQLPCIVPTGGWGFADFRDGKPASEAVHNTCFPCHAPAKDRDFVFTRYAP